MTRQQIRYCLARMVVMALSIFWASALATPRPLDWDALMPPGWEPPERDLSTFFHDAEEPAAPQPDGPVVEELHDQLVSIRGFVVPLEWEQDSIREFLFVPWFGACIHVPPPPQNQIIHVTVTDAITETEMFYPQILTGRLRTEEVGVAIAAAGYSMVNASIRRTSRD